MKNSTIALLALTQREVSRFMRVWAQTLVPPIITSVLYILIFGYSLGSRIKTVGGVSYLEFILPGLLMMGVIMSSYSNTSSSVFIAKFQKNIQEVLVSPLSYGQTIFALVTAGALRSLLVGIGILVVALLFTSISLTNIFILLFFILIVGFIFSLAGIITGIWATSFDKMTVFSTFLITPLIYLGGVFYSIKMLPPFWQTVAQFNPILYMVDGFRYGFIGTNDVSLIASFGLVIVLAVIAFTACVWMLRSGYKLRT